jgi:hypothetical protein
MPHSPLLPGAVTGAPVGALGCDTVVCLGADHVQTLVKHGFKFCVRYVNYTGNNLTAAEAQTILEGGLALMVVQAAFTGTVSAALGMSRGQAAAQSCATIGLPPGVNVWLDVEGISGDIFGYANCWHDAVAGAGYVPGIYIGANVVHEDSPVTGQDLYSRLKFKHYWRSQSQVPNVEHRGYQMFQLYPQTPALLGFNIDINITQNDYKHDAVRWLAR